MPTDTDRSFFFVAPEGLDEIRPEALGLFVRPVSIEREDRVQDGVPRPPDPAPMLSTWLTVTEPERPSGHRLRRTSFADDGRFIGLTADEVYERAVRNVVAAGVELEPHPRLSGGVRVRSSYLSGALAAPEVLEAARAEVDGELLVLAPTVREVTLVGADDPALGDAFVHAVGEYAAAVPQGLSPLLYRIVPAEGPARARLEPWVPEPTSPWHRLYQRARLTQLELCYGPMMQEALAGDYSYEGRLATVARPQWAYNAERNALLSYAVWSIEAGPSLVAPADCIAVNVARATSPIRYWIAAEDLATVPGVTMTETRAYGPPVFVVDFPDVFRTGAVKELLGEVKKRGGLTANQVGGVGEPAQVHDWVPSKNGWYGSRVTDGTEFPDVQWHAVRP